MNPDSIIADLLDWYDRHRRSLPWRALPGETPDPYHVWLSEIMLQQTTVATVGPYFAGFLDRWPTLADLAAADQDAVMHVWQGLGYYSRARNLLKCAQAVVAHHNGRFPKTETELLTLPGIGPYTAAAIAAIAFDQPAMPVDGNIERVTARLFAVTEPLPAAKPELRRVARTLTPQARAGDAAQALMDLGATICAPRKANCLLCPLQAHCRAHALGIAETLPKRAPRKQKPTRHATFFWAERSDGGVLFRKRPDEGLLGGLMLPPSTPWREDGAWTLDEATVHAPAAAAWHLLDGGIRHTFTHFHFEVTIAVAAVDDAIADGHWARPESFGDMALPTLGKKIARHALSR